MRRKSDKTKRKEKYGTGHGADYKPYIRTSEFNSAGTCANPVDWKTGRTVQLLSQGEKYFWYLMRWNDHVIDIREQYPLPVKDTMRIAEEYGILHPHKGSEPLTMTSDFLVDFDNNMQGVFSIKLSKKEVENSERIIEKLFIEKKFWESKKIPFHLVYKEDLNVTYAENIRAAVQYYHLSDVHDSISMSKYMVANKMIIMDIEMQNKSINFKEIADDFKELIAFNDKKKLGD